MMLQFVPQDLANTAWAFAKLVVRDSPLFEALAAASRAKLAEGDPQNWANLAWSWATLKVKNVPLMQSISAQSLASMKDFGPQELANIAWSCAHLLFFDAPLLHAPSRAAITTLKGGCVQNVTNTAWAFAQLKYKNTTFFNSISSEVIANLSAYRERDMSIMAWSFARREVRDDTLMDAIASSAIQRRGNFVGRAQELANLAWAVAPCDYRNQTLLEAIASAAIRTSSKQFSTQELTNILWSFASLKCRHEPLLESLAASAQNRSTQACSQNLVNTAWALDVLDWTDPQLVLQTIGHFLERSRDSLGVEWTTLAAIVDKEGLAPRLPDFMREFHRLVLGPVVAHLTALRQAPTDLALADRVKAFQDWVVAMQVPSLGAAHTRDALAAVGAVCEGQGHSGAADREWVRRGREAILRSAWWSCPHAAVSSQGVVAWVSARLEVVGGAVVSEPGRVFVADDSAEHSILVERMLQPVYLQVPRNGHAERRALISLLRQVSRAFGYDHRERWSETKGYVQLYASHFLCISCLASVAQFCRRMPQVSVQVEFDNAWADWEERPFPETAARALGTGAESGAPILAIGRAV